ncbi:MAG: DUF551 domain-containing protein [Oscillospiraceae bacterium]|nr:DUF551 domain-containing protein [Oscillospiraceae bacterium]MBQ1610473.1 DUF551 domain-containing protein [Muribaculaceae bacterium]
MTREEQVKEYLRIIGNGETMGIPFDVGFECGVEWADTHHHWISVEDELPKEDGRYLFYHTILGVQSSYYYNDLMLDKAVTHWMPLPAPPEHFADVSKKTSSSSEIPTNLKGGEQ